MVVIVTWVTVVRGAQPCYSWIDEAYVKGPTQVRYTVHNEFRAAHKVQRWVLKDGTWTKDAEVNVDATPATQSGGFYWEALYKGHCRLRNYEETGKNACRIKTRFQSPNQAAGTDKYTVAMRPSGCGKLQKYTLPGDAKEGEEKDKDNVATAAREVTITE